jgi:muramidase (phage lysozyme)
MSRNDNEDTYDTKFLHAFIKKILKSDKSIRWVAITDQDGNILNEQNREGVKLLLTKEENQESAINTIIRQKTRTKFEPKIGKLSYALGRYQKMSRSLIPINENFYLILTIDFEENNFDKIIIEKIIPFIKQEKEKFVTKKNESI